MIEPPRRQSSAAQGWRGRAKALRRFQRRRGLLEVLNQQHVVASFAVKHVVHKFLGQHDAKAARPQALLLANPQMAKEVQG